ncbi:hypothetical protein [Clostridium sp. KNHs205]|uniref:hypothetical protein n=1 Tax=Clostridium sp. KNHs205 TaxID=1449050 RepID=UPI0006918F85|nr:hypothetical protein [Clostridium sp. KNHs205]
MIDISTELKNKLRNDILPLVPSNVEKDLIIHFPVLGLTIETDQIVEDSFSLEEALCSSEDLVFGSCESSLIRITVADVTQDLKGQEFTVTQVVEGESIPLGTYWVFSCKKQDDLRFKDVVAYDKLKYTDTDVASWYNGLTFPLTLAAFRGSLLSYLDIEEEERHLPNDNMTVEKTIDPVQLKARDVLQASEEINGAFGRISRYGKFKHVILEPNYGLYPADNLYPSDDLYPVDENDTTFFQEGTEAVNISVAMRSGIRFEEYTVKEIDKLQIRQEEGDIGAIVGTGTNAYVIQGNFLVFGKSAEELETIAINAFGNMQKRPYRPFESQNIGLPYVEVGDTASFEQSDTVSGYILKRNLTGIQALRDTFSAEGNEEREQNFSLNTQVIQLLGKSNVLKRTVEEMSITITDMGAGLQSQITQTAGQLQTQITDTKNNLESQISQTATSITQQVTDVNNNLQGQIDVQAGQIALKVDTAGVIAAINLSGGGVKIEGTKIDLVSNAVSIVGKLYLNLNDNDTAVYAVSSGGTSNVVSFKNTTNESGSYQAVVIGDTSEKTAVYGDTVVNMGRIVSIQATSSSGYVGLSATRSGGSSYSMYWNGQYLYPLTSDCYIGGPGTGSLNYWNGLYTRGFYHHSSGTLGFFGATQRSKQTIPTISTSSTLANVIDAYNNLVNALKNYGLV